MTQEASTLSTPRTAPERAQGDLLVLGAHEVENALAGREKDVIEAVSEAYQAHARGESSLPHSSFLRFPDSDKDRIISLPAYLGGDRDVASIKWIASVPSNLERGLERASAVMILNDRSTGRPWAVLEGSIISRQRTAASAALAARTLHRGGVPESFGFVGCGPINLEVARFLTAVWPEVKNFVAFDLSAERATRFGEKLTGERGGSFEIAGSLDDLLSSHPVVSFATTTIQPHVSDLSICQPGATILHVSLRDLMPEVILNNINVVDDFDHVNRAGTSIVLASEKSGNGDFVHGSIGEILLGKIDLPSADDERRVIFSPFGLGILDLAVANLVTEIASESGAGYRFADFLPKPALG